MKTMYERKTKVITQQQAAGSALSINPLFNYSFEWTNLQLAFVV